MRVVKIMGGLGNQLFGYAFYRKVKSMHEECYVDIGWFDDKDRWAWFPYQLDLLGLKADIITRDKYCVKEYYMENNDLDEDGFYKVSNKIEIPIINLEKESNAYACDELWKKDNAYYFGCFQNIQNMASVMEDIKKEIVFPVQTDEKFKQFKKDILNNNAVSLHIRFCDYDNIEDFEKICPREYYIKAIEYIQSRIKNAKFFVFSNNIERAKMTFSEYEELQFVDVNDRHNGIGDMELMTLCQHNIIPNSTFGWWGAVLNKNLHKIVIAPDKFNNKLKDIKNEDINLWFNDWVRIKR